MTTTDPSPRTCAYCSRELPPGVRRDARYCSPRCSQAARRTTHAYEVEVPCPVCGREFWQRKYLYTPATCSSSCGQRYRKRGLLTSRETEVLALIKDGLSNKDIAARLEISAGAAANVVSVIYHKLGVKDRAAAVEVAQRR